MEVNPLRRQLEQVRHDHFNARTPSAKARCRQRDAELRSELAELLRENGLPARQAKDLAEWDPYDQNHAAKFFDSEWMFGISRNSTTNCSDSLPQSTHQAQEGGFDIVIGNPPYIRIQTLKKIDPKLAEFYKVHYKAASKGNYDLYVVFIEAGLNMLKQDGHLDYILPHTFFNALYGESVRGLIAKGQYLRQVVHFGHQQVFPGASNYVCLMFLDKAGAKSCRFVRVDELHDWLKEFRGAEGTFPAESVTEQEWNFTVGQSAGPFDYLRLIPQKLEDVTLRIFQGIKTSADKIYIVEEVERSSGVVRVYSQQTESEHDLEPDLLHPLVKGGDSHAYSLTTTNRLVIFPYQARGSASSTLIDAVRLQREYPLTWAYLCTNQAYLRQRENGKMDHDEWYGYVYPKALDVMPLAKVFTPDLAPAAAFSYDASGKVFFTGGVAGGYGIIPRSPYRPEFLLGLLNSRVLDFYHHKIATSMRGGWYSYEARFIKRLPIANASEAERKAVEGLVEYLIGLNKHFQLQPETKLPRDQLMLNWWEQIINGLVYELYFAEEIHARGLRLFNLVADAEIPELHTVPDHERVSRLRKEFERTYDTAHPLRGALSALRSLEVVRTIEGEE